MATDQPAPTLGRVERSLIYGTGCKIIVALAVVLDLLVGLVFFVLDRRNRTEEPEENP